MSDLRAVAPVTNETTRECEFCGRPSKWQVVRLNAKGNMRRSVACGYHIGWALE